MNTLTIVIIIGITATLGALATGIFSMARGGDFDVKHSAQLMFSRVTLQAITFILLILALYLSI